MIRAALAVLVVGGCIAGAALAQTTVAAFEPRYESAQLPRHVYPEWAIDRNISGFSDICCTARPDRSLDCRVAREWPENARFGRASVRLSNSRRLTQASYDELRARQNQTFQISTIWVMAPISQEAADEVAAARGNVPNMCSPGSRAPAPGYVTGRLVER